MKALWTKKNCMMRKLRSRAGESIAETLVAVLISALALTMLAGAISAATNAVTKSKTHLDQYYNSQNDDVVTMTNGTAGKKVTIKDSDNKVIAEKNIVYYTNSKTTGDRTVISYKGVD
jgi:hypothetical protein